LAVAVVALQGPPRRDRGEWYEAAHSRHADPRDRPPIVTVEGDRTSVPWCRLQARAECACAVGKRWSATIVERRRADSGRQVGVVSLQILRAPAGIQRVPPPVATGGRLPGPTATAGLWPVVATQRVGLIVGQRTGHRRGEGDNRLGCERALLGDE
jgi:hypothetical protein